MFITTRKKTTWSGTRNCSRRTEEPIGGEDLEERKNHPLLERERGWGVTPHYMGKGKEW